MSTVTFRHITFFTKATYIIVTSSEICALDEAYGFVRNSILLFFSSKYTVRSMNILEYVNDFLH